MEFAALETAALAHVDDSYYYGHSMNRDDRIRFGAVPICVHGPWAKLSDLEQRRRDRKEL
jgi:hypothetical protein